MTEKADHASVELEALLGQDLSLLSEFFGSFVQLNLSGLGLCNFFFKLSRFFSNFNR